MSPRWKPEERRGGMQVAPTEAPPHAIGDPTSVSGVSVQTFLWGRKCSLNSAFHQVKIPGSHPTPSTSVTWSTSTWVGSPLRPLRSRGVELGWAEHLLHLPVHCPLPAPGCGREVTLVQGNLPGQEVFLNGEEKELSRNDWLATEI